MIQTIILITSMASVWLIGCNSLLEAALIGLIGQPFWLYETHRKKQWGIFLLSVFYCAAWFRTVIAYWP